MTAAASEWVWLARIRRPQGRKGEVLCEILSDFPDKFSERKHLWLIRADQETGLVTAHDFSRAEPSLKNDRALAPAGVGTDLGAPSMRSAEAERMGGIDQPRPVELVNHWLHKGGVVLHFAGIDSISAAEALSGLIVAIPRAERAALAEDEVYIADLIGCELIDVAREPAATVGRIENVDRTAGPVPLLIVKSAHGEVLVPFAKSYLRKLDLENTRVEMTLPEGLTDL